MENNCQKDIEIKSLKEAIGKKNFQLVCFKLIVMNCFNDCLTKEEIEYLVTEITKTIQL
jgi:hypothetical protein